MDTSGVLGGGDAGARAVGGKPHPQGNFCCCSSLQNLHQLVVMRNIAAIAQTATIAFVERGLGIPLPLLPMGAAIAFLLAFNYYTWRRVQRGTEASEREVMLQLLVDIAVLTVQLGLSGGATNPFAAMYLLPVTIIAAWLPRRYAWTFALAALASFTLLIFVYRPLLPAGEEARMLELLVIGRWVSFAIIAAMTAHFVTLIASSLRADELLLERARSREMIHEQVVRIGTLAAGTAHELSTPLATMALVVEDLRENHAQDGELQQSLASMHQQLRACRATLSGLLDYGDHAFARDGTSSPADQFLRGVVAAFRARRPDARVVLVVATAGTPPPLPSDIALGHAISNLMSNAADVSNEPIEVTLDWGDSTLRIVVRDHGPGIPPEVQERLGTMFFTTKARNKGTGLGLALANLAIIRLGGTLSLTNAEGGGAKAIIELPTANMAPLEIDLMEHR